MRWLFGLILVLMTAPGWAEGRIPSDCIALAAAEPSVVPVDFTLTDAQVRIRFLQHASFAIESKSLLAITDYTGVIGGVDVVRRWRVGIPGRYGRCGGSHARSSVALCRGIGANARSADVHRNRT